MPDDSDTPRRRDVLRTGAAAGLLGVTGLALDGASAQETTTAQAGGRGALFSYSLREGDRFRIRYRPREPFGGPATETVPAACLGGDQDAEYQLFMVRAFRNDEDIGFRGLLAPERVLAEDLLETTTAAAGGGTETAAGTATEAAMQEETTTAMQEGTPTEAEGETTTAAAGGVPELQLGEWYRVTSSEACDGLNRLAIEPAEPPQTTVA
ncbi:hypothetical protein [Halorussus sp. AFM4]|uniref:hypothetical protein n=1 Tax=Halorussus sp. AFM4 TaxID=3421651 RepID=UPI003EBAA291